MRWWQPYESPAAPQPTPQQQQQAVGEEAPAPRPAKRRRSWLPPALAVTTDPEGWVVGVEEGGTAEQLLVGQGGPAAAAAAATAGVDPAAAAAEPASGPLGSPGSGGAAGGVPPGGSRAVYVLTAVICHIKDEDELEDGRREGAGASAGQAGNDYEGHVIAHIRVPPSYYQPAGGAQQAQQGAEAGGASPRGPGRPAAAAWGSAPSTPSRSPSAGPTPASPQDLASLLLPSVGGKGHYIAAGAWLSLRLLLRTPLRFILCSCCQQCASAICVVLWRCGWQRMRCRDSACLGLTGCRTVGPQHGAMQSMRRLQASCSKAQDNQGHAGWHYVGTCRQAEVCFCVAVAPAGPSPTRPPPASGLPLPSPLRLPQAPPPASPPASPLLQPAAAAAPPPPLPAVAVAADGAAEAAEAPDGPAAAAAAAAAGEGGEGSGGLSRQEAEAIRAASESLERNGSSPGSLPARCDAALWLRH